jgi:hypothetical protein
VKQGCKFYLPLSSSLIGVEKEEEEEEEEASLSF